MKLLARLGAPFRTGLALVLLAIPSTSIAICAETFCSCGFGGYEFLFDNGMEIPADSPGVPFRGPIWWDENGPGSPDPSAYTIERVVGDRRVSVPVRVELLLGGMVGDDGPYGGRNDHLTLVGPRDGFQPGSQYVIRHDASRDVNYRGRRHLEPSVLVVWVGDTRFADVAATGGAALHAEPADRESMWVVSLGGSCGAHIDAAFVPVTLELPAEAQRWSDVLLYTATINGEIWRPAPSLCSRIYPGQSWAGRGREKLFISCGTAPEAEYEARPAFSLEAGTHTVTMTAWWPGLDAQISASVDVELACATPDS